MARRTFLFSAVVGIAVLLISCGGADKAAVSKTASTSAARITFVELGSTTCIPCKKMQPVMKAIETRYAGQVKVIFHDVMKDRAQSQAFGIKLIPTQVFLDSSGKELMRHEGFFAEEEIDKFLKAQGLTPLS
ncbi:MAG TPA: thioredoxin family protein [bacterium]|jgi:thioredoxin 1